MEIGRAFEKWMHLLFINMSVSGSHFSVLAKRTEIWLAQVGVNALSDQSAVIDVRLAEDTGHEWAMLLQSMKTAYADEHLVCGGFALDSSSSKAAHLKLCHTMHASRLQWVWPWAKALLINFHTFLVSSHAMQLIEVQESSLPTDFYRKWFFSLKSLHKMLAACLTC